MKIDWAFLRWVGVWYAVLTAAGFWILSSEGSGEMRDSFLAGVVMSLANFLLGFFSVEFAFDKSHTVFLKIVLGGMGVRLFLMALAVLVLIKVYHFDSLSLMFTLLGYYAVNLTLEIVLLQKKVFLKNKTSEL
ncbi:MAG: hypothetical protein WEB33_02155 [Bacteroidota bacterium]